MYRWQDPPPPAAKYRRERASIRRFARVQIGGRTEFTIEAPPAPAPTAAPVLVVDGVEYVEAPERGAHRCNGCAFEVKQYGDSFAGCNTAYQLAGRAFGDVCSVRSVIYIRKA